MMIETAIAVAIMLFGAGGYQALASVDFKPIRITINRQTTTKPSNDIDHIIYTAKVKELKDALEEKTSLRSKYANYINRAMPYHADDVKEGIKHIERRIESLQKEIKSSKVKEVNWDVMK